MALQELVAAESCSTLPLVACEADVFNTGSAKARAVEAERLRALAAYDVLDTAPEAAFDRLTQAAAALCGTPVALVSLVDDSRQWFKSRVGVAATETGRDIAFCAYAITQDELFIVEDARADPRFADNPLVTGDMAVRFYAGAPLITPDGHRIGTLCVLDTEPRPGGLNTTEASILSAMAAQVVSELELRRVLRVSQQQHAELTLRERELTASVAAHAALLQAQHDSSARYRQFFEVTHVEFWTADATGILTGIGSRVFAGSARPLRPALRYARFAHPDDRAVAGSAWARSIAAGCEFECELRRRDRAGAYRWARLRAFPERQRGVVVGWYGTIEDVHDLRLAAQSIEESETRFRRMADDAPVMIWMNDSEGVPTYLSANWYRFTGTVEDAARARGFLNAVHPDDRPQFDRNLTGFWAARRPYDFDFRVRHRSGEWCWMSNLGRPRFDSGGTFIGYVGSVVEIGDRKRAEQQLAIVQQRLDSALTGSGVGVWDWDGGPDGLWLSASAFALAGIPNDGDRSGDDWRLAVHPGDLKAMDERFAAYLRGESETFEVEVRVGSSGGMWRWVLNRGRATLRDARGRILRASGTLTDIDGRKRAEERLTWTVNHDALTGLPNRVFFHERLQQAMDEAARTDPSRRMALALLDLDLFKQVNDVFGHVAGDALLRAVAHRLRDFLKPGETAARLGGDEFTLIIPDCGSDAIIEARFQALLEALRQPYEFEGQMLDSRASIGITCYPDNGSDATTLLKNADMAMYRAKAKGRGTLSLFRPSLARELQRRVAVLDTVRAAIRSGGIVPYYQAQLSMATGRVTGFEALLRLADPDGKIHLPETIDEAFEDSDLGVAIGICMMRQIVADIARWHAAGVAFGHIAVNASAVELRRSDYAAMVLATLAKAGVAPAQLHVEVTESVFLGRGSERVEAGLKRLSQAGVKIALDDFGTGFASLSHLKKYPIDVIKIDRSFVRDLKSDGDDAAIVGAVIGLAHNLSLEVVAEGVERIAQARSLRAKGCEFVQGYLYHRPAPAVEVPLIAARRFEIVTPIDDRPSAAPISLAAARSPRLKNLRAAGRR